jgi:hypothetical protein
MMSRALADQGREHPFTVAGLSAGNIGVTSSEISGQVNLRNLADFSGNYTSLNAAVTLAGGGGVSTMRYLCDLHRSPES